MYIGLPHNTTVGCFVWMSVRPFVRPLATACQRRLNGVLSLFIYFIGDCQTLWIMLLLMLALLLLLFNFHCCNCYWPFCCHCRWFSFSFAYPRNNFCWAISNHTRAWLRTSCRPRCKHARRLTTSTARRLLNWSEMNSHSLAIATR